MHAWNSCLINCLIISALLDGCTANGKPDLEEIIKNLTEKEEDLKGKLSNCGEYEDTTGTILTTLKEKNTATLLNGLL